MRRLAALIATIGVLLIVGTVMIAMDTYLSDDRKDHIRGEINATLDDNAAAYERNRENGCGRRCGGSFSNLLVSLRDGLFMSLPVQPVEALPNASTDWKVEPYSVEAVTQILASPPAESRVTFTREHTLHNQLAQVNEQQKSGAVRIYRQGASIVAVAISIDKRAIRDSKHRQARAAGPFDTLFATLHGLSIHAENQTTWDRSIQDYVPVDYHQLALDIDGQVEIQIFALGDMAHINQLLQSFDLREVIESLPQTPSAYQPDQGFVFPEIEIASESN